MKNFVRSAILALLAAAACSATTVIPMSVEELTRAASHVVEGRALNSWSAWNPQHTLIYTYTSFQVSRSLKGGAVQTITVKQLGGSAGGYTQKVSGVRRFQAGEDALLFLRPSVAADGTLVVVGLMQGHFRMARGPGGDTVISNGVYGANQLDRQSGKISTFTGMPIRLRDAESRIQKAVTQ